jgi:hypothetical protein
MVTGLSAAKLPNVDAFGTSRGKGVTEAAVAAKAGTLIQSGSSLQVEPRLGVPTMLWADRRAASSVASIATGANVSASSEETAARGHLERYANVYGLSAEDISSSVVAFVHNTGKGPIVVKFQQKVGGIDIFREELNVLMTQKLEVVAIGGYISSTATPAAQAGAMSFNVAQTAAATNALRDATQVGVNASQLVPAGSRDGYDYYNISTASGVSLDEPVRMKKVYFHLPEGLEAAYYVEVIAEVPSSDPTLLAASGGPVMSTEGYAYVISAVNGGVLFRKDLSADAAQPAPAPANTAVNPGGFTLRVWADPVTGIPYDTPAGNSVHPKLIASPDGAQAVFVPQNDVTLSNIMFSQNDPWLAPGSTETVGNNVDAFLNLFSPDGFGNPTTTTPADPPNGDYRAQVTGAGQFLHTHVAGSNPTLAEARQGSIQQLFYNNNFLHDWYYDAGFNEVARNAQTNNFGRGGLGNDSIKAQADDFSGFSNANMLTPADGSRPRMRMYTFPSLSNMLDIQSPALGKANIGVSMSGPQAFDFTTDIVVATFSNSPSSCTVTNAAALNGKIAMFDFDNTDGTGCSFSTRIARLTTTTGASVILMAYTSAAPTLVANITGFVTSNTKGVATISWNNAGVIKSTLAGGPVTARLFRDADRDGTIDNQIVFHEWGHYLSNRLIGNSTGLNTNHAAGMGEGWGDFNAMMLTVRAEDTATASNATFNGAYALATFATSGVPFTGSANNGYYYGIRRYPYSTDMNINPLTFQHIQDGTPLPVGPPVAFGANGATNSEVHNTGEVWAQMMWECYASLMRDTLGTSPRLTFAQAQDRMKQYLVASLAMTPSSPTFLEARDAVLAAAYATDARDYVEFQQAFAKRGAGRGAVSPDRYSTNNVGVVESYATGADIVFAGASLNDSVASCDHDGVLDSGDTGVLTVTLRNDGTTTLNATTATISSSTPGVSFPNGNTINFPSSEPLAVTAGSVNVAFAAGIAGMQQIDFQISYNDTQASGPFNANASFRGNTNDIPAASATDTVEAHTTPWSVTSNPAFGPVAQWARKEVTAMSHVWHGTDRDGASDEYLTSPVFTVDGSGSVNVQFDHSWGFEFDASANYDGGVIEMSVNGGAWTDIGTPAYNGTILNSGVNPLKGRQGFVKNSPGTVHTSLTQAIAPGSTVQVRFRAASDAGVGAAGWDVDNIAFTGVVETPFAVVVADSGCAIATSTTLTTSANPSSFGTSLTLTATVSSTGGQPTGTVTFFDGASPIGTGSLTGSVATFSTSTLSIGAHSLSARYEGDAGHLVSTSATVSETITKAATSVTISASASRATFSQPMTFTATVTSATAGSVTFFDGATPIGSSALTAGVATLTVSNLSVGAHSISATYTGNASYAASSTTVSASVVIETAKSDFTAEGKSDIVLQNSSTSAVAAWQMNGSSMVATNPVATPTADWKVVATGDLEGDGKADIILQNVTTGVVAEWRMNGLVMMSGANIATASTQQRIVGTYDFNHDGKADIILQNTATLAVAIWQMNGSTISAAQVVATPAAGWKAIAGGNIGGDAIILQNTGSGDVARWLINGFTLSSGTAVGSPGATTKLIGLGDFNTDGVDDLLFQSTSTNAVSIWRLNSSASPIGMSTIATPAGGVTVLGAADYDGNGRSDLLLQTTSSNTISMWQTDGVTLLSGAVVATPVAGWKPVVN